MNHEVFKDLAPSYIENLTSEETNRQMEQHMEQCVDCREYLKGMQEDLLIERTHEHSKEKINIDYFKKVRSKNKKKIFTIVGSLLAIFIIISLAHYFLFVHMWIADENNVQTTIQKQDTTVTISFKSKNDNRYLIAMQDQVNQDYNNEIIIYENWGVFSEISWIPFSEFAMLYKDGYNITYTFLDENTLLLGNGEEKKLTDEDKILIMYKDSVEEVLLKDLYSAENNK